MQINYIKPNDHIESLGKEKDDEYQTQLIIDAINKLKMSAADKAAIFTGGAEMIDHLKKVNALLVNVASAAWVEGILDKLILLRANLPIEVNTVFIDGLISEYRSNLIILTDNVNGYSQDLKID